MSFKTFRWCLLLLSALGLFATRGSYALEGSQDSWDYQFGRGLRLGDSGFWMGGYAEAFAENYRHRPWEAELADISLFLGWEKGRWRFFSELELGDLLSASNGRALSTHHAYFDLERLYVDYLFDDQLKVRVGKFLTPIGRWNLIHAAPLVWTTSVPLVVQTPFAMHQTGGMAYGDFYALDKPMSYAVYGSGGNELDFGDQDDGEPNDNNFRDTVGLRINSGLPGQLQFGLSYAHYTERFRIPGQKNLLGLDFFWAHKRYELGGEFVYRFGIGKTPNMVDSHVGTQNLWGLYLQGVAPLVDNLYAVIRYEAFQFEDASSPVDLWVIGLAYRPLQPLVFKVEYSVGTGSGNSQACRTRDVYQEGFAASVAVLF